MQHAELVYAASWLSAWTWSAWAEHRSTTSTSSRPSPVTSPTTASPKATDGVNTVASGELVQTPLRNRMVPCGQAGSPNSGTSKNPLVIVPGATEASGINTVGAASVWVGKRSAPGGETCGVSASRIRNTA